MLSKSLSGRVRLLTEALLARRSRSSSGATLPQRGRRDPAKNVKELLIALVADSDAIRDHTAFLIEHDPHVRLSFLLSSRACRRLLKTRFETLREKSLLRLFMRPIMLGQLNRFMIAEAPNQWRDYLIWLGKHGADFQNRPAPPITGLYERLEKAFQDKATASEPQLPGSDLIPTWSIEIPFAQVEVVKGAPPTHGSVRVRLWWVADLSALLVKTEGLFRIEWGCDLVVWLTRKGLDHRLGAAHSKNLDYPLAAKTFVRPPPSAGDLMQITFYNEFPKFTSSTTWRVSFTLGQPDSPR